MENKIAEDLEVAKAQKLEDLNQNPKKKKKKLVGAPGQPKQVEEDSEEERLERLRKSKEDRPYALGQMYDEEVKNIRSVDYKYEQVLLDAESTALKRNDLKTYEEIKEQKLSKAEMIKYMKGDEDSKRKSIDMDELKKEYNG